ncbi:unnamed protein product [Paramecium sonneborni]|uniref:Uncharacterized protein n=1 Tax=Paramecium sonneborni TaxID=65129 RepID=A0A8S1K0F8_9CILI|nr:unnamed protein product [Paramecium sonneborni]
MFQLRYLDILLAFPLNISSLAFQQIDARKYHIYLNRTLNLITQQFFHQFLSKLLKILIFKALLSLYKKSYLLIMKNREFKTISEFLFQAILLFLLQDQKLRFMKEFF